MSAAITAAPAGIGRGLFRAGELSATTLLVTAVGEVDAANAGDLHGFVEERLAGRRQLVLDLSRLAFFGTDGLAALRALGVGCSRRGVDWVLVPGSEVVRLLRFCDPAQAPATAADIVSAVALLARGPEHRVHPALGWVNRRS